MNDQQLEAAKQIANSSFAALDATELYTLMSQQAVSAMTGLIFDLSTVEDVLTRITNLAEPLQRATMIFSYLIVFYGLWQLRVFSVKLSCCGILLLGTCPSSHQAMLLIKYSSRVHRPGQPYTKMGSICKASQPVDGNGARPKKEYLVLWSVLLRRSGRRSRHLRLQDATRSPCSCGLVVSLFD